jgi:Protein of unknown function (DUF3987)/CHC2 zinc finger
MYKDPDLEEARRRLPLQLLMQQFGFDVRIGQNSYCPFHPDQKSKHKSFSVYQRGERFFWKCWGQCGESGDEVRFLEKLRGISNYEARRLYKELTGVTPRPESQPKAPFNWSKCVEALTPPKMERLATWRRLKKETVCWAKEAWLLGIYKDRYAKDHYAFPVFDRARRNVVAAHYRLDNNDWLYYPKGVTDKTLLLTIGEVIGEGPFHAFESQWDGLSFVDVSGEESGIIITRGKSNGRLVPEALQPGAIVYVWTQHDSGGHEWEQDVCKSGRLTVKRAKIPAEFKDLNDWVKAGATVDDLVQAIQNAETIATATTQGNGQTQGPSGSQAPAVDLTGNGAEEPEEDQEEPEKPPDFPIECFPPALQRGTRAISNSLGVPLGLAAPQVLGVGSMSLGKGLRVRSGRGRVSYGNLYILIAKVSGAGGSITFRKAFEPFDAMQQILRDQFDQSVKPYLYAELADISDQFESCKRDLRNKKDPRDRKEITDKRAKLEKKKAQLEKHIRPLLYITNITRESLVDRLAQHGEVMTHVDADAGDTLSIVIGDAYQPSGGNEKSSSSVWLAGYTGDPITLSRRSGPGEPHHAKNPCLTTLFLCTPDFVQDLFARKHLTKQGLLPRFLVCNPKARPVPEDLNKDDDDFTSGELTEDMKAYRNAVFATCNRYYRFRETKGRSDDELDAPISLYFDQDHPETVAPYEIKMMPGAQRLRKEDFNRFCELCEDDKNHPFESRHTENAIRIALVLHAFTYFRTTEDGKLVACAHEHALTEETMRNAIISRDWFKAHQERMRGPEQAEEDEDLWKKVEKLTKRFPELRAWHLCNYHVCESMEKARQLLNKFESSYLRLVSEERKTVKGRKFKVYLRRPLDRQWR